MTVTDDMTWTDDMTGTDDTLRPDDIDGQLCDGQQPAVDVTTGRMFDCDSCPPSTYCHRLSTSSACCWIGNRPSLTMPPSHHVSSRHWRF